jgi:phosphoribosylaminoimidazole-succinocarboxamide synthase
MDTLFESDLPSLASPHRGKVRDIYQVDDDHLLIVATDRLSAFDVVLPTPIPDKGRVLTAMSYFWCERLMTIVPNHLTTRRLEDCLPADEVAQVRDRAMLVRRIPPLPLEAIVRGYISGSAWAEYQRLGTVCGLELPAGLQESDRLPVPIFTPSTKAEQGDHDQNISFEEMTVLLDGDSALAERVRETSLQLYESASAYALERGIIIADTKFEFGLLDDEIYLIDEVFTPDSSRFWPQVSYVPGQGQPSFDKQYVRDYLTSIGWEKQPPAPELPLQVVQRTTQKYREALHILTGES